MTMDEITQSLDEFDIGTREEEDLDQDENSERDGREADQVHSNSRRDGKKSFEKLLDKDRPRHLAHDRPAWTSFSGDSNRGVQIGSSYGNIVNNFQLPQEDRKDQVQEPFEIIPLVPNPDYIARGDILNQIEKKHEIPAARAALVGLGGVGKSQIAIQYAYQVREKQPHKWVFWVYASNPARFDESYQLIAERLGLVEPESSQSKTVQLVYNWLSNSRNGPWVMVVDNADNMSTFFKSDGSNANGRAKFMPQVKHGCYLITSRNSDVATRLTGNHRHIIQVSPMNDDEGRELIKRKLDNPEDDKMVQLLEALDHIPLAVTQATAYINRMRHGSISRYLKLFYKGETSQRSILSQDLGDNWRDHDAKNSIIITWQISFDYIRQERPSAADLLSLMSVFNRQDIPEFILRNYVTGYATKEEEEEDVDLALDFEEDLLTLQAYYLVAEKVGGEAFQMHRLVQFCTQVWLQANGGLDAWWRRLIDILAYEFPVRGFENWKTCKLLYPHAEIAALHEPDDETSLENWNILLYKAAGYAYDMGMYLTGEDWARKVVAIDERTLGKESVETCRSMQLLGRLVGKRGKYEEAEELHRQTLQTWQKLSGHESDTITSMINLASALKHQRNYQEAENILREALTLASSLPEESQETPRTILGNLATVLLHQLKYVEAEKMYREVLQLKEAFFGKEHPQTLLSINNLGSLLVEKGEYEEGEVLLRQALRLREIVLGGQHPQTMNTRNTLANAFTYQGKHEEAEELYRQVLESREVVLGKQHPSTLNSLNSLATCLREQERFQEAEDLLRETLRLRITVLGELHPDTLISMSNLGVVLIDEEKYQEAEELLQETLELEENGLGENHSTTLETMEDYAELLELRGKDQESDDIRQLIEERWETIAKAQLYDSNDSD